MGRYHPASFVCVVCPPSQSERASIPVGEQGFGRVCFWSESLFESFRASFAFAAARPAAREPLAAGRAAVVGFKGCTADVAQPSLAPAPPYNGKIERLVSQYVCMTASKPLALFSMSEFVRV